MIETILKDAGIACAPERLHVDWCAARLVEYAVSHGEGVLTHTGSLMVETGKYTGRSPKNRYIVDAPSVHANVNWASPQNRPCDVATYDRLYANVAAHLSERELFIVRAFAGADRAYARKVMVVCERASQALFIGDLLVTPTAEELENFGRPDITVLAAPDYTTSPEADGVEGDAAVMLNFETRGIVVAGTGYSGEIKKGVFTTMSYLLPVEDGVLPMHCSANVDPVTGKTAVLFGLSGTGKTTLIRPPTPVASSSATTSTAGAPAASSTSRAAATRSASTSPASASRTSTTPSASGRSPRTWCSIPRRTPRTTRTAPSPRTPAPATRCRISTTPSSPAWARRPPSSFS